MYEEMIVSGTVHEGSGGTAIVLDEAIKPPSVPPGVPLAGFGAFVDQETLESGDFPVYLTMNGTVVSWDHAASEEALEACIQSWADKCQVTDTRRAIMLRDTRLQMRHFQNLLK